MCVRSRARPGSRVELDSGERFIGTFQATPDPTRLAVVGEDGVTRHDHIAVVRITQMQEGWWGRVDGSLDLGFSFTKANEARQWNLSGDAVRRTERLGFTTTFSSLNTAQEGVESTSRQALGFRLDRYLPRRWLVAAVAQFQQNEELQLKLRSVFGGAVGRYLVQSNRTVLSVLGGGALTRERFSEPGSTESNAEALAIVDFKTFTFDDPETDISATLVVIPSLTEAGRVRVDFDSRVRREILKDFYFSISFFDNFDSRPPVAGLERNDYGLISSFGWAF